MRAHIILLNGKKCSATSFYDLTVFLHTLIGTPASFSYVPCVPPSLLLISFTQVTFYFIAGAFSSAWGALASLAESDVA